MNWYFLWEMWVFLMVFDIRLEIELSLDFVRVLILLCFLVLDLKIFWVLCMIVDFIFKMRFVEVRVMLIGSFMLVVKVVIDVILRVVMVVIKEVLLIVVVIVWCLNCFVSLFFCFILECKNVLVFLIFFRWYVWFCFCLGGVVGDIFG